MVLAVCLALGPSGIGIPDTNTPTGQAILILRVNRVMSGFVVGAALACAGMVLQAVLRNPWLNLMCWVSAAVPGWGPDWPFYRVSVRSGC